MTAVNNCTHPDAIPSNKNQLESGSDIATIFTGVPRSGTTLLGDLANRYLDVGALNEGPFELWLAAEGRKSGMNVEDDLCLDRLLTRLSCHEYFKILYKSHSIETATIALLIRKKMTGRTLQDVATAVLRLTAERLGRRRLGHEDPLLIGDLSSVIDVIPHCRIVHIIRDPRDVAASILRFPWGANNVVVSAWDWNRRVRKARALGEALGRDRYLEVRYEDLLASPEQSMTALMRFVCGGADAEKVRQFVHEMAVNPRRNNAGKWRQQLSPRQVNRIEACAGKQMELCGYRLAYPPRQMGGGAFALWRLHHRLVQLQRIMTGKLSVNGGAKLVLAPEE
jgi:hypothetical protein